jgi:membrane protein
MQRLPGFLLALWNAAKRFYTDDFTYSASALAFTTLLALVPIFSVVLSLLAMFPIFAQLMALAQNYLLTNFLPTSSTSINFYLENFTEQATRLPIVGICFLFFTATMLIITVENTLNDIWQASERKKKFSAWFLYWVVLIVVPILIGCSVFLSTLFLSLSWFSDTALQAVLKPSVLALISLLINTTMFSLLYIILPNCKVGIRNGLEGGLLAAVLFEIAKKSFAFYVERFPSYEVIYGTLAIIPIFLLWVYISWMIVLYGALFTHEQDKIKRLQKKKL